MMNSNLFVVFNSTWNKINSSGGIDKEGECELSRKKDGHNTNLTWRSHDVRFATTQNIKT